MLSVSVRNFGVVTPYKPEWVSWPDWYGTATAATNKRKYCSFEDARAYARSLGLKSADQWRAKSGKRPADIPAAPDRTYAGKGWVDWPDWLGTGDKRR
jgi:hypothetical protein